LYKYRKNPVGFAGSARGFVFFRKNLPKRKIYYFHTGEKSVFFIFSIFSVKDRKVVSQDPAGQIGLLDRQRWKNRFFRIFQLKYFEQLKYFGRKKRKICLKWQCRKKMKPPNGPQKVGSSGASDFAQIAIQALQAQPVLEAHAALHTIYRPKFGL
jgi:hypothetical protein